MYLLHQNNLIKQIYLLKKKHKLFGIKAEFEAEGSSFEDVSNLRSLTFHCNTKLFVKIDKFWLFMIFMFIYLTILKEGIKTNDLNLEYN